MVETQISLTEQERQALHEISQRTGKTESELIRGAIDQLIIQFQQEDRLKLLQPARGIWQDRQDLLAPNELRGEGDRPSPRE